MLASNPRTLVRRSASEVQGHPGLHSKFKAHLGHMEPHLKNSNKQAIGTSTRERALCIFLRGVLQPIAGTHDTHLGTHSSPHQLVQLGLSGVQGPSKSWSGI